MSNIPSIDRWQTLFLIYGSDVNRAAANAWLGEESGGNPCAIGDEPPPGAIQPQEYGLAQLNAHDPSNLKIATPETLRPMCGVGHGHWQTVTRPLTDAEMIEHAVAALGLMRHCADKADAFLGLTPGARGVGSTWLPSDFWRLTKCYHASSALANLFPQVAKHIGRQPPWLEFRSAANTIALANGFKQPWLDGCWHNIDKVGEAVERWQHAPIELGGGGLDGAGTPTPTT